MKSLQQKHFDLLDREWENLRDPVSGMVKPQWLERKYCPVCKAKKFSTIFIKKGLSFVRCVKCTHVFINPQLKIEVLEQHFKSSKAWDVWSKNLVCQKRRKFDVSKYQDAFRHVEKMRGKKKGGKVLDIGCSSGVFLNYARSQGWEGYGVEPSLAAVEFARKNFKLDVFCGSFKDYESCEKFDLITLWASLEYNKDVSSVIKKAGQLLNKGGFILVLISGNSHSLVMRALREKCVGFIFNRTHSFNPASLNVLMGRHGFQTCLQYSILPETRILINYLDYQDPYINDQRALFSDTDVGFLNQLINRNCMGYKFISIYERV